jgi:predicted Zn-dependent peptidase
MPISDIQYTRERLPNGLDLVLAPLPKSPTITAIIIFKTGSRHEPDKYLGISHFLEHMVFKGNKVYRTPHDVAAKIEGLGGSFNAFTGKEYTGFHVKVGAEFSKAALEWLGALVTSPLIPAEETEMERNVILEEINMYNDTPMMQIEDIYEGLVFQGKTLGRNVIGTKKSLSRINGRELKDYFRKNYFSGNAVLVLAGDLEKIAGKRKKVIVDKYFNFPSPKGEEAGTSSKVMGGKQDTAKIVYKKTDQTHLILGAKTFSYFDRRRYPLAILSTIVGGGMSSWAFTEIREKRGLAYYVHGSSQLHSDSGSFYVGAGLNNNKLEQAIGEIKKLFARAREGLVSPQELKKAKDQAIGGMALSRETSSDIAFILASEIVARSKVVPFSEEVKIIKSVTARELRGIAEEFFAPEKLRLAMIGPWKKSDEDKFVRLLK